ncbi:LacI family DNA-binding transcriptional regulator [Hoeflea prorocentri]|uniref:LacI family DNA-binding transcriptional regulator n=1 Tax=Hoeflea prorocentri TaxID=1922333 RepID=A0A9X3UIW0_9HYPH|nr:LacI family DNA-binding transcriptional regulator [Hoeflea prorocentri]MCY6382188.1 LacI family DNA-binding transcriptional regulator [Hoeflea prorocentri]MDA5399988.1 LacI family DNA-binding transcriptional regulator [Hoeflea prorocentri]
MKHRFPLKEIAHQAGVGIATVDRVIHGRPGVRPQTANRVRNAISELEAQETQLSMRGRKLMLDLLVEAPQAFLDALDAAVNRELPLFQSAIFRIRRDIRTRFSEVDVVASLDRALKLGSDGVIVMAPDTGAIRKAVNRLVAQDMPVVTLATDMPGTSRSAYVGLDNFYAGETAAWMVRKWSAGEKPPRVLVTVRNDGFQSEGDRERSFRKAMERDCPASRIETFVEGQEGPEFSERVARAAAQGLKPSALYSIGGGNPALLDAMSRAGIKLPLFIAHDLDPDNRLLLAQGRIDAVIYHDLADDIRNACQVVMSVHSKGAIPLPSNCESLRVVLPPMLNR